MTNLYHRELFPNCPTEHFQSLLDKALSWMNDQGGRLSKPMIEALQDRLHFRKSFLHSLHSNYHVDHVKTGLSPWKSCANFLPALFSSHGVGVRVSEAFNIKIQRRLASTVPPRPIVNISFQDAHDYLCKLCKDGQDVESILQCRTGREIQVSPRLLVQIKIVVSQILDIRITVQRKRKPTARVYQMPPANAHPQ